MSSHLGRFTPGSPQVGADTTPRNGHTNGTTLLAESFRITPTVIAPESVQPLPNAAPPPTPPPAPKPAAPPPAEPTEEPEPAASEKPTAETEGKDTSKPEQPPTSSGPKDRSGWDQFWIAMAKRVENTPPKPPKPAKPAKPAKDRKPKRQKDRTIPGWAIWVVGSFLIPAAGAAFVLSFQMIQPVVLAAGWNTWASYLGPIVIDVAAIAAAIMGSISAHPIFVHTGHFLLITATTLSIVLNLAGHRLQEETQLARLGLTPEQAQDDRVVRATIAALPQEQASQVTLVPAEWEWAIYLFSIMVPVILAILIHAFGKALMAFLQERRARKEAEENKKREDAEAALLAQQHEQDAQAARDEARAVMAAVTQPLPRVEAAPAAPKPEPAAMPEKPKPPTPKPQKQAPTSTAKPAPKPTPKPAPKSTPSVKTDKGTSRYTVDTITEWRFTGTFDELRNNHETEFGLIVQRIKAEDAKAQRKLGRNALYPMFSLPVRLFTEIHQHVRASEKKTTTDGKTA